MRFSTKKSYTCRENKMEYVYDKYKSILDGKSVLDIGADMGYLQYHLPKNSIYTNIGYGKSILHECNLENIPYPFSDKAFDTVLCLDVLEHLENIHAAFDECMRLAKQYVIISLPNAYNDFWGYLVHGNYKNGPQNMKFYGLPIDPPEDRHRWFFGSQEAQRFIAERAKRSGFRILQFDTWKGRPNFWQKMFSRRFFHPTFQWEYIFTGTMWFALERANQ